MLALKKPCVMRWKIAKAYPAGPMPAASIMYPIWLMVEPASTFLMSSWLVPIQAPASSVTVPTTTTAVCAIGAASKIAWLRTTRYTPAVTIVAAWIRADTGVGPSMASSSHACSGTWADLPQAPSSRKKPIRVAHSGDSSWAPAFTSVKEEDPNMASMVLIAISRPKSPTRFITNALTPAAAADGLCCQKLISR